MFQLQVIVDHLAQSSVHARVLGIIECLVEEQIEHSTQNIVRFKAQIEQVTAKFVKFFRCNLVEDSGWGKNGENE